MDRDSIGSIIAGLGIFDTLILLDETYNNSGICGEPSYFLGYTIDCGHILKSDYARVIGIPLSLLGFIFYTSMFILFNIYNRDRLYISNFLLIGSIIGLLASIYFVYIQLGVLGLICPYCMGSALTSTSLFTLMIFSFKSMKNS